MNKWQLKIAQPHQRQDVLGNEYFMGALFGAIILHVLAYYIWHISPKPQVIDIPVRAMNLKIGELDTLTEVDIELLEPSNTNHTKVENVLSKLVRSQELEAEREKSVVGSIDKAVEGSKSKKSDAFKPSPPPKSRLYNFDMRSEGKKSAAPVMKVVAKQFVRDLPPPAVAAGMRKDAVPGGSAGNSTENDAEIRKRYTQLISAWVGKFSRQVVRQLELEGEVSAHIQIDRRGNIKKYAFAGAVDPKLKAAALDVIRKANPVPAPPANYPANDNMNFIVQIRFTLE